MPRRKPLRSPRLARKIRRKRTRKTFFFSIFILATILWSAYGLLRPAFRLTSVEVVGSGRVPTEEVRARVLENLSGAYLGVIPKSHTFLYPKAKLEESLVKEFPALGSVALSVQGVSSLRVFLREREPVALWCAGAKDCFLIDETGTLFAHAEEGAEESFYRLEGVADDASLGARLLEEERLRDLLLFLAKLEGQGLAGERVLLKEQNGIEVTLSGGTRLLLREGEYERALINLETLLSEQGLFSRKDGVLSAAYVDLRYGNKIYFRPR